MTISFASFFNMLMRPTMLVNAKMVETPNNPFTMKPFRVEAP